MTKVNDELYKPADGPAGRANTDGVAVRGSVKLKLPPFYKVNGKLLKKRSINNLHL